MPLLSFLYLAPASRMLAHYQQQSAVEFRELPARRRGVYDSESDLLIRDCLADAFLSASSHQQTWKSEEKVSKQGTLDRSVKTRHKCQTHNILKEKMRKRQERKTCFR